LAVLPAKIILLQVLRQSNNPENRKIDHKGHEEREVQINNFLRALRELRGGKPA
jgi:hypothetical protein